MDVCHLLQQLLLQELEPQPALQLLPRELEPQPELQLLLQELEPQPELQLLPQELEPQPELQLFSQELEPQPELQLRSSRQPAEPNVSPKPQQERGCVEGENRSSGKGMQSKLRQGSASPFVERLQGSGTQLPKLCTSMFTVRNSLTMVNRPNVTLTAMGAPIDASPLSQPQLPHPQLLQLQLPHPQLLHPQLLQQLLQPQPGYFNSAARPTAFPSAVTKGPPWELPQQSNRSDTVVTSDSVEPNRVTFSV